MTRNIRGRDFTRGPVKRRADQMELVTEAEMRARLAELVEESTQVRMAVAFWRVGSLDNLNLTAGTTRIICNLARGATNPHEIDKIRNAGIEVFQHDDLHAKAYLFNRAALIGSSNASANGLAYQGEEYRGWVEANVLLRDETFLKSLGSWFEQVWVKARPIGDDDIARALDEWSKRRFRVPRHLPPGSDLLKALAHDPDAFSDRRLYLAVCSSKMDEEGQRLLSRERRSRRVGYQLGAFQEWENLPDDAT